MSKKIRQFFAVLLLLVFITPTAVKLLDDAFHHHLFYAKQSAAKNVWHSYHRTCPIPGFTLSVFSVEQPTGAVEKPKHYTLLYILFTRQFFSSVLDASTLLRAPPLSK